MTKTAVEKHVQIHRLNQQIVFALLPKAWKTDEPPTVLCRNPRKAPLSSFPANDYTPSSVTWAVDSRILLRLVLRSPRSTVKAYSPAVATAIATVEPISFSKCQAALIVRETRIKMGSVLSLQGRFPGRLIVPAYAVSRVASPSSPKHYRMTGLGMRSLRIRFFTPKDHFSV